jgi:hypothetical protein
MRSPIHTVPIFCVPVNKDLDNRAYACEKGLMDTISSLQTTYHLMEYVFVPL